jgi:Cu+-exporting ATPase
MFLGDEASSLCTMANSRYDALQNEDLYAHLFKQRSPERAMVVLSLPSMHCASCVRAVETWPNLEPGLIDVRVNFNQKEAHIRYNPREISLQAIAEKLDFMGYPPDLSLAQREGKLGQNEQKRQARQSILELGVAGFVFGNTMLFAFPEYMGLETDSGIAALMRWITAALSLPLVLYSGRSYFKSALGALRTGQANMDVPIALGIVALWSKSLWDMASGTGAGYFDSLAGLIFFLLVGRWFQNSTIAKLDFERDYTSFFPLATLRLSASRGPEYVGLNDVEPGDELRIRHGELIPMDAVIVRGRSSVDVQFITGEALPLPVGPGDDVAAGSRLHGGSVDVRVVKALYQSYLTSLWREDPAAQKPVLSRRMDLWGQWFTWGILGVAVVSAAYWLWADPSKAIWAVTSVLIVACPCALALSIPFGFGNAIRLMGQQGAYVKSTDSIERLARVNAWVMDKTGTLTHPEEQRWSEEPEVAPEHVACLRGLVQHSAHPISRSLHSHWKHVQADVLSEVEETIGAGLQGRCSAGILRIGSPAYLGLTDAQAPAHATGWSLNGHLGGWLLPEQVYREGLSEGLDQLRPDPIALLTGDGDQERSRLQTILPASTEMRFRQSPKDKLNFVLDWQKNGKHVAMVGDGLNDAGALAASDVGISIAEDAMHFAPACDILLQGRALPHLARYPQMAKAALRVVKINIAVSLGYNVIGLTFAVQGLLTPEVSALLMPISSLSVVGLSALLTQRASRKIFKS